MRANELRHRMGQQVNSSICKAIERKLVCTADDGRVTRDILFDEMSEVEGMIQNTLKDVWDRRPECIAQYFRELGFHVSYGTIDGHTVFHFDWSWEF